MTAPAAVLTRWRPPAMPAPARRSTNNPWESSVTAGLTLTRGNSDTLLFTAGV